MLTERLTRYPKVTLALTLVDIADQQMSLKLTAFHFCTNEVISRRIERGIDFTMSYKMLFDLSDHLEVIALDRETNR